MGVQVAVGAAVCMAVVVAVDVADAVAVAVRHGIAVAVAVTVAAAVAIAVGEPLTVVNGVQARRRQSRSLLGPIRLGVYDESSRVVPKIQWACHERAQ